MDGNFWKHHVDLDLLHVDEGFERVEPEGGELALPVGMVDHWHDDLQNLVAEIDLNHLQLLVRQDLQLGLGQEAPEADLGAIADEVVHHVLVDGLGDHVAVVAVVAVVQPDLDHGPTGHDHAVVLVVADVEDGVRPFLGPLVILVGAHEGNVFALQLGADHVVLVQEDLVEVVVRRYVLVRVDHGVAVQDVVVVVVAAFDWTPIAAQEVHQGRLGLAAILDDLGQLGQGQVEDPGSNQEVVRLCRPQVLQDHLVGELVQALVHLVQVGTAGLLVGGLDVREEGGRVEVGVGPPPLADAVDDGAGLLDHDEVHDDRDPEGHEDELAGLGHCSSGIGNVEPLRR